MNLLDIFSGGMTKVYKYLAIGGLILGGMVSSYFYGNHVGVEAQKVAQQQGIIKTQERTITITKTQTVIDTKAVDSLQKQLDSEKATNIALKNHLSTLTNQNLQEVKQTTDGKQECVLSKEWVDTYNASIKGANP